MKLVTRLNLLGFLGHFLLAFHYQIRLIQRKLLENASGFYFKLKIFKQSFYRNI